MAQTKVQTNNSQKLYDRAQKLAPAGVHSPVRAFRAVGGTPLFFERGKGSRIWDVDGNEYIDFCMSWGALALGHAEPHVVQAVQEQASRGTHFGTPTRWDVDLAELALSALTPFEQLRFVNSGTEAVMTALRLARGITGRDKIVKLDGSYHGHSDSLLVNAGSGLVTQGISSSSGVTAGSIKDTIVVAYGNLSIIDELFEKQGHEIAALIVEPIMANNGLFEIGKTTLQAYREITKKHGSMLIFDEVITGFRVDWGGAKSLYDIAPDIGTYGKILGGGMPVGAVAARAEHMNALAPMGKVYQAGTLSANPIAMTAGLATLRGIKSVDHYQKVRELGKYLDKKMDFLMGSHTHIPIAYKRTEGIFWICPGTKEIPKSPQNITETHRQSFKDIYHSLLKKGIYLAPSVYEVGFISSSHTKEDLDRLVEALANL